MFQAHLLQVVCTSALLGGASPVPSGTSSASDDTPSAADGAFFHNMSIGVQEMVGETHAANRFKLNIFSVLAFLDVWVYEVSGGGVGWLCWDLGLGWMDSQLSAIRS
jgi:hypothetical protein